MADLQLRESERQAFAGDAEGRARLIVQKLRSGKITERRARAAANAGDAGAKLIFPDIYYNPCKSCDGEPRGGPFNSVGCYSCSDTGTAQVPRGLIPTMRGFPLKVEELRLTVRCACLCLAHVTPKGSPQESVASATIREAMRWVETGDITSWLHDAHRRDNAAHRNWNITGLGPAQIDHRLEAAGHIAHGICGSHAMNIGHAVSACYRAMGSKASERKWQLETFCDIMVGLT